MELQERTSDESLRPSPVSDDKVVGVVIVEDVSRCAIAESRLSARLLRVRGGAELSSDSLP